MVKIKTTKMMESYFNLSLERLETVKILYDHQKWRGVISNSYYSCYDLIKIGLIDKGVIDPSLEEQHILSVKKLNGNYKNKKESEKKLML